MINTNLSAPRTLSTLPGACPPIVAKDPAPAGDSFKIDVPAGFEPWLGGKPTFEPCPPIVAPNVPDATFEVPASFEPWLTGQITDSPAVGGKFADKLTRAFGEKAILSLDDDRVGGVAGYMIGGLESVSPGGDWLSGVTLARLGDGWEVTPDFKFELKGGGVSQTLSFDQMSGSTRLESSYEENHFDTSTFTEILTRDRDGVMRRENPPVGL